MPGFWYVGASVLVLAVGAPLLVRGRLGKPAWYFGTTSLIAVILSDTFETPLDWLLYHLLPGFASVHPHAPERILTVPYLGPALLAGATITVAPDKVWWIRPRFSLGITRAGPPLLLGLLGAADLA